MTTKIPADKPRLLLVEGADDKEFFRKLAEHLGIRDRIHLVEYHGNKNLVNYLIAILQDEHFANRRHIGIVRDSDYNTNAFNSVISALDTANRNSSKDKFSIPPEVLAPSTELPYVSVLPVPLDSEGSLEDLVLDALQADPIMPCVNDYFACLTKGGVQIAPNRVSKSKLNVFITGKIVDREQATRRDARRKFLREAVAMNWWRPELWEHESFNDAKAFLQWLAAD